MANEPKTDGNLAVEEKRYKVITIPATERLDTIKLRVAAYARVSSSSDDQMNSFAAQNHYYTTLISSKENWKMVDIYADAGVTGTSAEKRPDFQRLLSDCRRGLIDRVLVKSISRFARNTTECLETIRELKSIGVSVFFEEQNIDTAKMTGEFLTSLFASIAQKESESISNNIRWGIQARMQKGKFIPSHQPFGYRLVDKEITIDEAEAKYVRDIFQKYVHGWNTVEIARYLNREKIDHPELNRDWTYKAVGRILKNEKYIGDSLYQKTYRTETLPREQFPNRGEKEQYYAENTHPAIIEKSVYQASQNILRSRDYKEGNDNSLFPSGLFICAQCGGHLRKKEINGRNYRTCRKHDMDGAICSLTPIREDEIIKAFLRLYYKLKHQCGPILKQFFRNLQTVQERRMLWSSDVIELNKQISFLSSQNQLLANMKKNGLVDPDVFISRSNELAEQLRAAKLQKERVLNAESDETIPHTRELMETLEAGPKRLASFDAELFGELVDRIIVESNERVRFRLKNGLELVEKIERTVR